MSVAIAAAYPERCQGLISISAQYAVEALTLKGISEAKVGFQQAGQMERLEKYHPEKAQGYLMHGLKHGYRPFFKIGIWPE